MKVRKNTNVGSQISSDISDPLSAETSRNSNDFKQNLSFHHPGNLYKKYSVISSIQFS